jgi:hypothetical protein
MGIASQPVFSGRVSFPDCCLLQSELRERGIVLHMDAGGPVER